MISTVNSNKIIPIKLGTKQFKDERPLSPKTKNQIQDRTFCKQNK